MHHPCIPQSMSDYSINVSNKSPVFTPPRSPTLPIPFRAPQNMVHIEPSFPPISPQTALAVLAMQDDLNDAVCAIAFGLISTIHNREVLHGLTIEKLTQDCNNLCHKVSKLTINLKDKRDNIEMPEGFELNAGHIETQVPISDGYRNTKWVRCHDNGQVKLLVGESDDKEPFTTNLYLTPDYALDAAEPIPPWF